MKATKELAMRTRATMMLAGIAMTMVAGLLPGTASAQPSGDGGEADIPVSAQSVGINAAPITRSEVLARAASWTGVPYSQDLATPHQTPYGAFRRDCSGFVSMAWGLPGRPTDSNGGTNTVGLAQLSTVISKEELKPGDALIDILGDSQTRHVVLFEAWANAEHTRYWAYEQSGPNGSLGVKHRVIPYPYDSSPEQYQAYRYDNIVDDQAPSDGSRPSPQVVRFGDQLHVFVTGGVAPLGVE